METRVRGGQRKDKGASRIYWREQVVWVDEQRHLYGAAVDEILATETCQPSGQSGVLWGLADNEGTIRDIVNGSTRAVVDHRKYDSYGNVTFESVPSTDFVFGYTGQVWDAAAKLYDDDHRWYDPSTGDFISKDPANTDVNLYRYCRDNPLNATDPSGLCSEQVNSAVSNSGPVSISALMSGELQSEQENLRAAFESGVDLTNGSDSGCGPNGGRILNETPAKVAPEPVVYCTLPLTIPDENGNLLQPNADGTVSTVRAAHTMAESDQDEFRERDTHLSFYLCNTDLRT